MGAKPGRCAPLRAPQSTRVVVQDPEKWPSAVSFESKKPSLHQTQDGSERRLHHRRVLPHAGELADSESILGTSAIDALEMALWNRTRPIARRTVHHAASERLSFGASRATSVGFSQSVSFRVALTNQTLIESKRRRLCCRTVRISKQRPMKSITVDPGKRPEDQGETIAHRREALIDISANLFADRGLKSTTVRAIATAAGIKSGSLYYHFESKEDIAAEIMARFADDMIKGYDEAITASENALERLELLIRSAFRTLDGTLRQCRS